MLQHKFGKCKFNVQFKFSKTKILGLKYDIRVGTITRYLYNIAGYSTNGGIIIPGLMCILYDWGCVRSLRGFVYRIDLCRSLEEFVLFVYCTRGLYFIRTYCLLCIQYTAHFCTGRGHISRW